MNNENENLGKSVEPKAKEVSAFFEHCWQGFKEKELQEAAWLLFRRWTLNKLPLSLLEGKACLDMGCGSGRYSYALLRMGASKVVGLDAHSVPDYKEEGFEFKQGDVLNLPFDDDSFDFVFCNGVLQLIQDGLHLGVAEAYRVLKPGGWLWVYVGGRSKLWDYADLVRNLVAGHPEAGEGFSKYLQAYGRDPRHIFFERDAFFAPRRDYYSKEEVEKELRDAGFKEARYLDKYIEPVPQGFHLRFIARKGEKEVKK